MAICPKCGNEITFLYGYSEKKWEVQLDSNESCVLEEMYDVDALHSFECPDCNEELFKTEGEAIEFLKKKETQKKLE